MSDKKFDENIQMHSAGATVKHDTPFAELVSHKNESELSKGFIDEWVVRFYMEIGKTDEEWLGKVKAAKKGISREIVLKLLGDFDWRTRQTGAFFAAVNNYPDFTDIIGTHFLKSELTYAGQVYALVLAYFNTEKSREYLIRYLSYYLDRPDLWFDQGDAMQALKYLDEANGTDYFSRYADMWTAFLKNKPYWEKDINTDYMKKQVEFLAKLNVG